MYLNLPKSEPSSLITNRSKRENSRTYSILSKLIDNALVVHNNKSINLFYVSTLILTIARTSFTL